MDLSILSPTELEELAQRVADLRARRKAEKEAAARAAVRMDDPHGTVRYLNSDRRSERMFLVRMDDPDDDHPYWQMYLRDDHGIPVEDGVFDPAKAPIVGRIDQ